LFCHGIAAVARRRCLRAGKHRNSGRVFDRLQNAGFDAPTPTTVIGAADIQKNAQPSVFETVTQLPCCKARRGVSYNTGSTTTGLQGISSLNLRGLGVLRTLTLIDSQRIVGSNPNGAVDVSQMPQDADQPRRRGDRRLRPPPGVQTPSPGS